MIGRQGLVIKSMSEQSNCQMQLAEMNDPYDTKERIMVINGKNGSIKDLIQVSPYSYHIRQVTISAKRLISIFLGCETCHRATLHRFYSVQLQQCKDIIRSN